MRIVIIAVITALSLAGCATVKSSNEYGDFFPQTAPPELRETLVNDTVKQLLELYPPASTRFDLAQPTADGYGSKLIQSLRHNGYALSEPITATGASPSPGVSLRYVLDSPLPDLYRVTVLLGSQSLSRAYENQNAILMPAGVWVRRE